MSSTSDVISLAVTAAQRVQAEIPPTREARDQMLRQVRGFARGRSLVPPVHLEELTACTDDFMAQARIDPAYRRFVAVLLNNELWRDTLAGIPFDRRLLLLPQCLRDTENCAAKVDGLGLICNHCGQCPIHDVQTEAEGLGYVVLVAEGSPVVMSLVRSGQVEGIIGVSCLDMLERVFPYMEAAAVPGLALPLLCDGCDETVLDMPWLWDAIHLIGGPQGARLDLENLRGVVDSWFTPEVVTEVLGPADGKTEEVARQWLIGEGKRWRPLLVASVYRALQGGGEDAPIGHDVRQLALAVECFHKASLVHDDIEDADAERYGQPTVHEMYGMPFAINVGDLLVGEGYRLIAEAPVDDARRAAMLAVAAAGHRTLCLGQGAELHWAHENRALSPAEVLDIFAKKTSPAFEVALRLGAICAGADGEVARVLSTYSEALGVAYQICDDLDDLTGGAGDLHGRRPSIVLAAAYAMAAGRDERILGDAWHEAPRDGRAVDGKGVREIIRRLGVEAAVRNMLDAYKDRAIRSLFSLNSAPLKRLMRRLVAKIFGDAEVMSCCNDDPRDDA